jgi:hypothetical protein
MKIPEKIKELAVEGFPPPTTPAEVGRIIKMMIVAELEISALREDRDNPGALNPGDLRRLAIRGPTLNPPSEVPTQWAKDAQMLRGLRLKSAPS